MLKDKEKNVLKYQWDFLKCIYIICIFICKVYICATYQDNRILVKLNFFLDFF